MKNLIVQTLALFPKDSQWKLITFLSLLVLSALLEMAGVGLIMPFIAVLDKPEIIQSNQWFRMAYEFSGQSNYKHFFIWCSTLLIIFYLAKNMFIGGLIYWQSKFLAACEMSVASKLLEKYLYMPYEQHLMHNTAQLINNINVETSHIFSGFVKPVFIIITDSLIMITILGLLCYIAPFATLAAILVIGTMAALFYYPMRNRLQVSGERRRFHRSKMTQWINQSLGSVKELIILGRRKFFQDIFDGHAAKTAETQTFYETVTQIPRLVIESFGIITLLTVTIIILNRGDNFLPTLSLFAMAAFRMMPAINRITSCAAKVRYYLKTLHDLYSDLTNIEVEKEHKEKEEIRLSDKVILQNVSYGYPGTKHKVLNDLCLTINKGASIGIVGPSGAGKSTLVDVLLGLLKPDIGHITLDGKDIQKCMRSWRDSISYIPQVIYLIDDTIRRNIALGVLDENIDDNDIWQALEQAELADVIRNLPKGLDTEVGERGVRLSGGQRQRIGIARAFYNKPSVLVLDEVTTGLDPETERSICQTLKSMKGQVTMIAISHQPALTSVADEVYRLHNDRLEKVDNPTEIFEQ